QSISSKQILIATDADEAGDDAAKRLYEVFTGHGCQAIRLRPSYGKDWNDALVSMGSLSLRDAPKCFEPGAGDAMQREFARRLTALGRTDAAPFVELQNDFAITHAAHNCEA